MRFDRVGSTWGCSWNCTKTNDTRSSAGIVRRPHPMPLEAVADTVDDLVSVDRPGQQQHPGGNQFFAVARRW